MRGSRDEMQEDVYKPSVVNADDVKKESLEDFEAQEELDVVDLVIDRKDFRGILRELRTKFR